MPTSTLPVRTKPIIGITMGDSNGIGPEILVKALDTLKQNDSFIPVVYGNAALLNHIAQEYQLPVTFTERDNIPEIHAGAPDIPVIQCGARAIPYTPGILDPLAGANAALWIRTATEDASAKRVDGMVTCPVNKDGMLKGGCPYAGHTPMLAALTQTEECYMSLFSSNMRIVHITAHLSMKDAVAAVKKERIYRTIKQSYRTLNQMGFEEPRIAVAGLNPHAGEMGAFGTEELEEIQPAVDRARQENIQCTGPLSPDTVFSRMNSGEFDVVVAMYHDQGHIPFKLINMDEGVHATLGLPFVRTSPDHGTAFDIAGTGKARAESMCAALLLSAQWAMHTLKQREATA